MPISRMASFCRQKAVLVSVYVERPRRRPRASSSNQHHHHHHHHHPLHHSIRKEVLIQYRHGGAGNGYDRRAELLRYAQSLRASARPAASDTSSHPMPISSNNHQPATNIVAARRRPKDARTPACLGNCKSLIPTFFKSLTSFQAKKGRKKKKHSGSTTIKMKAVMKRLEVQKKLGFLSKLVSTLRNHR